MITVGNPNSFILRIYERKKRRLSPVGYVLSLRYSSDHGYVLGYSDLWKKKPRRSTESSEFEMQVHLNGPNASLLQNLRQDQVIAFEYEDTHNGFVVAGKRCEVRENFTHPDTGLQYITMRGEMTVRNLGYRRPRRAVRKSKHGTARASKKTNRTKTASGRTRRKVKAKQRRSKAAKAK